MRTFSWSGPVDGESQIFEVQFVDGQWERSQVLAILKAPELVQPCVTYLRRNGWSWVPPESDLLSKLLRRAFASQLRTDVPAESTADPEAAFSGRKRS